MIGNFLLISNQENYTFMLIPNCFADDKNVADLRMCALKNTHVTKDVQRTNFPYLLHTFKSLFCIRFQKMILITNVVGPSEIDSNPTKIGIKFCEIDKKRCPEYTLKDICERTCLMTWIPPSFYLFFFKYLELGFIVDNWEQKRGSLLPPIEFR